MDNKEARAGALSPAARVQRRAPTSGALVGKPLPLFGAFVLQMVVGLLIIHGGFQIPFRGDAVMMVAAALLSIACYLAIGALLPILTKNLVLGLRQAGLVCSPAFSYAGVGFPTIAMNTFARSWLEAPFPARRSLRGNNPCSSSMPPAASGSALPAREDKIPGLGIGASLQLLAGEGSHLDARVTELRPLGEFATWRATRAVGDHDLNSFFVRSDPVDDNVALAPGSTVVFDEGP